MLDPKEISKISGKKTNLTFKEPKVGRSKMMVDIEEVLSSGEKKKSPYGLNRSESPEKSASPDISPRRS
jgi:hypothetical protein